MTAIPASYDMPQGAYPVAFEADPPAPQNRLSVFFRILFAIPHLIVLEFVGIAMAVVTIIAWFVILFTGKYPAGMMSFAIGVNRWVAGPRLHFLLTDKYPPFSLEDDSAYPIRIPITGQIEGRNRLTVFFRIIMILPHAIILGVLRYVAVVVAFIAWFAALFTGTVPAGLHSFIAGYCRWNARVAGYGALLTDEYPPFGMN